MTGKPIYLSPPDIGQLELQYVNEAFASNWIAPLGPHVDAFENEMATRIGHGRRALALSSGTAAIHMALRLLGVGRGDTVFCSSLTFVASANPVLYENAELVFIDSEPTTWNMSPLALERALAHAKSQNRLPKAVIIVDLYGQSADMDRLLELCRSYRVPVVEDSAEALGATYKSKPSGSFGDFSVLSFNGNKIITTSGGGMLLCNNEKALEKAKFWATQARDPADHYEHSELGFNYRLSNVLAGIGRGQLASLDDRVLKRRRVFERYKQRLGKLPGFAFMPEPEGYFSTRWLSVLTVDPKQNGSSAQKILAALHKRRVDARPVWKPLHAQPLFKGVPYFAHEESLSVSDTLFAQGLCLPSGSNLSSEDQDFVMATIEGEC